MTFNLRGSIIILLVLVIYVSCDICNAPQKQFYMSYDAIGNRQYLSTMFEDISSKFPKYNVSYKDKNDSVYSVIDLQPHLYYNQHRQVQAYHGIFLINSIDQYSVNVTLGQLYMTYRFDFKMQHENKNITGWARGRTLVDQASFLKKLTIIEGALEWQPSTIPKLDINSQFSIEYSDPKFTQDQTAIYIQLLNDYLGTFLQQQIGTQKIKENIINKTNIELPFALKHHLNQEELLKNNSIVYKWNDITLNFTNVIRDFKMNNAGTKGLQVFLLFGLQAGTQKCIDLPKEFDQDSYGGVQQLISMGTVKAAVQQASTLGLFNGGLDKKYQVPYFQFFMGDLGNFVDYANTLPAHDPFTVRCNFAIDRASQLMVTRQDQHDLYVQVPQDCMIMYKQVDVLKISFDMNLVVRIVAENSNLTARIYQVGIYGDKYFSLDSKFVVTNPYVARYALTAVLKGLVGKTVFGTGWPVFTRKYPVIRILDDYINIFDASEM